jgi:hypothetical protein
LVATNKSGSIREHNGALAADCPDAQLAEPVSREARAGKRPSHVNQFTFVLSRIGYHPTCRGFQGPGIKDNRRDPYFEPGGVFLAA